MNKLKQYLKEKKVSIGSWLTIGHPSVAEVMAQENFDWLCIDMEHTSIDYSMAQVLISTIQSYQMPALVRVSKNEEVCIKKVLDSGADGVIVPMVNSVEDAKRAIDYVYYPPVGNRGVGLYRAQGYGTNFENYKEKAQNDLIIIAQIEHYKGVENLEEIISLNHIDGIIIGPYDLSGSLGIPGNFSNKTFLTHIEKVEKVCRKHNFPLGYHQVHPNHQQLQEKIDHGYRFLGFGTDFLFMSEKINKELARIKK
jgi:2-dehydro-3-deoxyglucarate aldolase